MIIFDNSVITENEVRTEAGIITGSGGGIDFVCPVDDFGENECNLII
jgi:hypothetical protein